LAGCNRYGLDNPCPIITKRMACFGVQEDIDKDFKRIISKYKKLQPENPHLQAMDPEMHATTEMSGPVGSIIPGFKDTKKKLMFNFGETENASPSKK
jgi:hypothetical protein